MSKATLIVVPCYNEASRLKPARFISALADYPWLHLLFVNDGSSDGTVSVLAEIRDAAPSRIDYLSLEKNCGKAEAVRRGILEGAHRAEITFFGYWDADLATPLDELPEMVGLLERRPNVDMILASRVKLLGRQIDRRWSRHLLGRLFAAAASLSLNLAVYDTQCGAKLFRRVPDTLALFTRPFVSRWIFDVEILARLIALRADVDPAGFVTEHPLTTWQDVEGSKLKGSDFARAALDLARIYRSSQ